MSETISATINQSEQKTTKPALWNPTAAANLSVVFTPIFGAWIHAENWKVLGDQARAEKSMQWVYAGIVVLGLCIFMPDDVGYAPAFIYLIAWYIIAAKKQIKYVKQILNNEYERRPWKMPAVYGFIGSVVFLCIAVGVTELTTPPTTESLLEKQAVTLVNQIIAEQRGILSASQMNLATCTSVKIDGKAGDDVYMGEGDFYHATAILDNGNSLPLIINHAGDSIVVHIRE